MSVQSLFVPRPSLPLRFTLTAQSLFQIKRQLDKLGELVVKVTYECDPIPLQKPQLEERVKYLIYHLIRRQVRGNTTQRCNIRQHNSHVVVLFCSSFADLVM